MLAKEQQFTITYVNKNNNYKERPPTPHINTFISQIKPTITTQIIQIPIYLESLWLQLIVNKLKVIVLKY